MNIRPILALVVMLQAATAAAQFREININNIVDAVKGVAKSREVSAMSEADEVAVGKDIAARTLGAYRLVRDEQLNRYLNRVGLWVALQSDRPTLPWRFAAVRSEEINAFAVPGGAVLITTGMLNLVANEAELACVIGHEVGHIVRKHHLALLEKGLLIETGSKVLADQVRGGGIQSEAKRFVVKEGAELYTRALDRDAERDADADGVLYAARAGYDPAACQLFMERMAALKQDANSLAALYKTHPQASDRVSDVRKTLERLEGAAAGQGARPALALQRK